MADTYTLEFVEPNYDQFDAFLQKAKKPSLLQSFPYAYAIRQTQKLQPRLGMIKKNEEEIGFFSTFEASTLFGLLHVLTIDRGPCWFEGHGNAADMYEFSKALDAYAPARFGRQRRFMPEISKGQLYRGWKKREREKAYRTIWLDISKDEKALQSNMEKKWRNALSKAERQDQKVEIGNGADIPWFLQGYLKDRLAKKYPGPSLSFLKTLMEIAAQSDDLLLLKATQKNRILAAICIIKHGNAATYQTGWTTLEGRSTNAHHFLLWQAIKMLKEEEIQYLDMGGINTETAKGVTDFKDGIGGKRAQLIGQFG